MDRVSPLRHQGRAVPAAAWTNVQQSLKGTPDPAQPILWDPDAAWSSCDGSFAATTGEAVSPGGRKSRFLTVWQRQENGEYLWVLDQGFDSAGGPIDPEKIVAKVAECPKVPRPSRDVRRDEAWGSGKSNDGTLSWSTAIAADCSRTAVIAIAATEGMAEVFRKTAQPPQPQPGPRPHCITTVRPERSRGITPSEAEAFYALGSRLRSNRPLDFARDERIEIS